MGALEFVTVDVFTRQRFGGNPLAVFPAADSLSGELMQKIASEINYSETAFVLSPADPRNSAKVRIFTPRNEVPFAGHPNIGTAFVLGRSSRGRQLADGREAFLFEEAAGLVEVEVIRPRPDSPIVQAYLSAPQGLTKGPEIPPTVVASCLSLDPDAIDTAVHPPVVASVGLPFVIVRLRSLEHLRRCTPNASAFQHAEQTFPYAEDRFSIHAYVQTENEENGPAKLHARMFAPLSGIIEDPATGSANAATAALLADSQPAATTTFEFMVVQGAEMGRASNLHVTVEKRENVVGRVRVGGECVEVIEGRLNVSDGGVDEAAGG